MEGTTARLRKTFQYKADSSSSDSLPEALDEEEQETLIQTLNTRNLSTNQTYKTLFGALCLACTLPYLIAFFVPNSLTSRAQAQTRLLSILSITSLLASAYILDYLPTSAGTGFPWLDNLLASSKTNPSSINTTNRARGPETQLPQLGDRIEKSPLELYLPSLNLVLVSMLALAGTLVSRRNSEEGAGSMLVLYALLPGGVYAVVVAVRVLMGSVDVGELEGLRYGYKGA